MRFSVYVVWPSVLSFKNLKVLKIRETKAVKNICIQEQYRVTWRTGRLLTQHSVKATYAGF